MTARQSHRHGWLAATGLLATLAMTGSAGSLSAAGLKCGTLDSLPVSEEAVTLKLEAGDRVTVSPTDATANQTVTVHSPTGTYQTELPHELKVDAYTTGAWTIRTPGSEEAFSLSCTQAGAVAQEGGGTAPTSAATAGKTTASSGAALGFLRSRTNQIRSNDPDLSQRLKTSNNTSGDPLSINASGNDVAVSTTLRKIVTAEQREKDEKLIELKRKRDPNYKPDPALRSGPDVWVSGKWTHLDDQTAGSGKGALTLGMDSRLNPHVLIGMLAQTDWSNDDNALSGAPAQGNGLLAGPYVVTRLHENLVFDGRVAWGYSEDDLTAMDGVDDDVTTSRWLVKGQFTGDFKYDALNVAPHVGVLYIEDHGSAGQFTFGPKFSTTVPLKDKGSIAPFVAVKGLYGFESAPGAGEDLADAAASAWKEDLSTRLEAGLTIEDGTGVRLQGEAFNEGFNLEDARGGSAKVTVPLN